MATLRGQDVQTQIIYEDGGVRQLALEVSMKSRRSKIRKAHVSREFRRELQGDYNKVQPAHTRTSVGFVYQGKYHVTEGYRAKDDTIAFDDGYEDEDENEDENSPNILGEI